MEFTASGIWGVISYIDPSWLASWGQSQKGDQGMYLDPIYTIFKLALFNFSPPGSKLDFYEHKISVAASGYTQGFWRTVNNLTGAGSSWVDLYNLVPALYYGIKRLDPAKNEGARLLCILAWRGLESLRQTYANENPPNLNAVTLIQSNLQRMFEESFQGQELNPRYCKIANLDQNPLLALSDMHWMTGDNAFLDTHDLVLKALDVEIRQFPGKEKHIADVEENLDHIVLKINEFISRMGSVTESHLITDNLTYPIDTASFKHRLNGRVNINLQDYLWLWFKKIFNSPNSVESWNQLGIPIELDRDNYQKNFFNWLALPSLEESSSLEERTYTIEEMQEESRKNPQLCWKGSANTWQIVQQKSMTIFRKSYTMPLQGNSSSSSSSSVRYSEYRT